MNSKAQRQNGNNSKGMARELLLDLLIDRSGIVHVPNLSLLHHFSTVSPGVTLHFLFYLEKEPLLLLIYLFHYLISCSLPWLFFGSNPFSPEHIRKDPIGLNQYSKLRLNQSQQVQRLVNPVKKYGNSPIEQKKLLSSERAGDRLLCLAGRK